MNAAMGTDTGIREQIEYAKTRMKIALGYENWPAVKADAEHCARLDMELRDRHNERRGGK